MCNRAMSCGDAHKKGLLSDKSLRFVRQSKLIDAPKPEPAFRVSEAFLASVGAAAATHYEDPNAGPCQSGEEAVRIQGVTGSFCSPACKFLFKPCPKDVPPGTTATPQCNLETPGSSGPSQCSLVCQSGATCPQKATCKLVQGEIGLCTYDS